MKLIYCAPNAICKQQNISCQSISCSSHNSREHSECTVSARRLPAEDIQIPHRGHSYRDTYMLEPMFRHPLLLRLARTRRRRSDRIKFARSHIHESSAEAIFGVFSASARKHRPENTLPINHILCCRQTVLLRAQRRCMTSNALSTSCCDLYSLQYLCPICNCSPLLNSKCSMPLEVNRPIR